MALSMRCNAIIRPPLSQTAALILMLSSCAFASAPRMMRLASSSVRLIDLSSPEGIVFTYSEALKIRKEGVRRGCRSGSWDRMIVTGGSPLEEEPDETRNGRHVVGAAGAARRSDEAALYRQRLFAGHADLRLAQGSPRPYRHMWPNGYRARQADA